MLGRVAAPLLWIGMGLKANAIRLEVDVLWMSGEELLDAAEAAGGTSAL